MDPEPAPAAIAIDPGSAKCGVAVVRQTGEVAFRTIVPTSDLCATIVDLLGRYRPRHLLCGAGTGCKRILHELAAANLGLPVTPVDESPTPRKKPAAATSPRTLRAAWSASCPRASAPPPSPTITTLR